MHIIPQELPSMQQIITSEERQAIKMIIYCWYYYICWLERKLLAKVTDIQLMWFSASKKMTSSTWWDYSWGKVIHIDLILSRSFYIQAGRHWSIEKFPIWQHLSVPIQSSSFWHTRSRLNLYEYGLYLGHLPLLSRATPGTTIETKTPVD